MNGEQCAQVDTNQVRVVGRTLVLPRRRVMLEWDELAPGRFVLTVPARGRVMVTCLADGWAVSVARLGTAWAQLWQCLPVGVALVCAEDQARWLAYSRLADPNAAWRQRPASEKQLDVLRRWGLPGRRSNLTAGEASDLIAAGKRRAS